MIRTFRYPLYPTKAQEIELERILGKCCELYNAALEQRISAYRRQKKTVTLYDQSKDLTELRQNDSEYGSVARGILRSSLDRLDNAYKAFFRRVKQGEKPGFPRFRNKQRYDSFMFGSPVIKGNKLTIPKLGQVKFKLYRSLKGTPKIIHINRTPTGWYMSVVCDLGDAPVKVVPSFEKTTGVDVGLQTFATFADETQIRNPRFFKESEQKLAECQKKLSRKKKGSKSQQQAKKLVAKAHLKIKNQRLDHARKQAKLAFVSYDVVAYENLNIKGMVQSNLAKSINDAGWRLFINCLTNKAEEAGKWAIGVNPKNTSQMCSSCGIIVKKDLTVRRHVCACGCNLDRDHNAALNIKSLGWSEVAKTLASKIVFITFAEVQS